MELLIRYLDHIVEWVIFVSVRGNGHRHMTIRLWVVGVLKKWFFHFFNTPTRVTE